VQKAKLLRNSKPVRACVSIVIAAGQAVKAVEGR